MSKQIHNHTRIRTDTDTDTDTDTHRHTHTPATSGPAAWTRGRASGPPAPWGRAGDREASLQKPASKVKKVKFLDEDDFQY